MITKEQIIEALYKSAKKTENEEGILIDFIFANGADAILELIKYRLFDFAEFIDKDLIDNVTTKEIVERFLSKQSN